MTPTRTDTAAARGHLRVYLGAAPGVGKTVRMLEEGRRRSERGADVVIGVVETHGRAFTRSLLPGLELIPRRTMRHRGVELTEMDVDAVLARAPAVALVDELAHTNVTGSRHEKRWQDVEDLLDAGIDVITTLNIQHLESLNDSVARITGVTQRETIPDDIVRRADQIELVDMAPEALRRRMLHGNVYPAERVPTALSNYFRAGNLSALRELALLWVADRVDEELATYREAHGIDRPWETRERLIVAVSGAPGGDQLIRRAARMAERSRADLIGVHVRPADGLKAPSRERVSVHRDLLVDLGGEYHEIVGDDVATQLVTFARAENATQLVLGASRRGRVDEVVRGSVINRAIRNSPDLDVHVISTEAPVHDQVGLPQLHRSSEHITPRRRRSAWLLAVVGPLALASMFIPFRDDDGLPGVLPVFVLLVAAVALTGGTAPALMAAALGFTVGNIALTQPYGTLRIVELSSVVGLASFLSVAVVMAIAFGRLGRRTAEAHRARAHAEALASSAATLADQDPVPELLDRLRLLLGLDGLAVIEPDGRTVCATGEVNSDDSDRIELADGRALITGHRPTGADELLVMRAFGDQLSTALRRRELSDEALQAERLAQIDRFRTALLRSVSHDLRTPLASIKAAGTSLLQDDVDWPTSALHEFASTIVEEADRLDRIVANLLDASRLEAGVLDLRIRPIAIPDIIDSLIAHHRYSNHVTTRIPEDLPLAAADPALLERALENLLDNATRHSPHGVEIIADIDDDPHRPEAVQIRIVDHGPGLSTDAKRHMFDPFQRLGDDTGGVGLGSSVASGFVTAMGGRIRLHDTPGGGLTVHVAIPIAQDDTP